MKYPILYAKNETDFFSLGLGVMTNTLEASVTEERNGSFYFESKIIIDVVIYPQLENDQLIKVDAGHELKDQRFRIKRIVDNHNGTASIYAEHISYLSAELSLKPEVTVSGNGSTALTIWKSSLIGANSFVVDSDITTSNSTNWRIDKVQNARQALGGVEGSILEKWGGEYRFDNYHISLLSKRGTTADVLLAYGRNITDFEQERNIANTFNSVYPFAIYTDDKQQEHLITLSGYFVDSSNIASFPNRKAQTVDFSNEFEHDVVPSQDKLKSLAQKYITTNGIGVPSVSIKVSFVDLSKISDYENIAPLEQLNLCDEVHVVYPKLKVNTTAKVVRVVWNVLAESYDEIEIGEKRVSLSDKISEQTKFINEVKTDANAASVSANGKNTNFYGIFGQDGNGEPKATKVGDLWYKPNGDKSELYQWNGTVWSFIISNDLQEAIEQAQTEATEAKTAAQDAVDKANASVTAVQENTQLINDVNAIANDAKSQAQTAATNAQTALTSANTAMTNANKAISDAGKLSEDVLALDTIAKQAKSDAATALINANKGITDAKTALNKAIGVDTRVTTEITNVNNTLATKANSTTLNAIKGTVDSQGTAISQNATDIKLKADSTVVNAIKGTVDSQGTLISQNSKDIALKANKSSVDTLTGRVSANETAIDITAQGVSTLVTKTDGTNTSLSQFKQDYEGFKGTVYTKSQTDTKVSTVQQSVDNFKTTVSNTYSSKSETDSKVTAVQADVNKIGNYTAYAKSADGTDRFTTVYPNSNLLDGTKDFSGTWTNSSSWVTDGTYKGLTVKKRTAQWNGICKTFTAPKDGTYTFSAYVKSSGNNANVYRYGAINSIGGGQAPIQRQMGNNFDWIRDSITLNLKANDNVWVRYEISGSGTDSILWTAGHKWEQGSTVTDSLTTVYPNLNLLVNSSAKTKDGFFKNFDKVENDYGEVTIKGTNAYISKNMWDGFSIQPRDYKPNDKYTMSMDVMFTSWNLPVGTTISEFWIGQRYSASIDGSINSWKHICSIDLPRDPSNMLNQWIRITKTSTIPPYEDPSVKTEALFMTKFTGASEGSFTVRVRKPKQEQGSISTPWMPSESELQEQRTPWMPSEKELTSNDIPKYVGYSVRQSENPEDFSWQPYGGLNSYNITKATTAIEQNSKEIALKANKTEVDTLSGRVLATESSLQIQDGQITALNTKTDGHTTQIGTLESSYNGLTSTISKIQTDIGGKAGKTELSQLSQDLSGFKTTVANTYADKVSVASQITQSATAVTSNVQSWTNNKLTAYSTTQQTTSNITNAVASKADKSQITQLATDINLRVSKGDVTSQINIESGRVLIDSKQLLLNADTVKFSGSAFIPNAMIQSITADKITAGTINAANVNIINLNAANITTGTLSGANLSMNLNTGAVQFTKGYIAGNNSKIRFDLDKNYFQSLNWNNNGFVVSDGSFTFYQDFFGATETKIGELSGDIQAENGGIILRGVGGASLSSETYKASVDVGSAGLGTGNGVSIIGDTRFWGGISVLGSKNAIHITRDGIRATPAYEMAESYLGDIGRNYTREDCEVWVHIDELFSDTVNTDIAYEVFLQAYSDARFWVSDFKSDKFLVRSDKPMARFAWEIKAKRRGYENDRLVIQEGVDNKILLEAHSEGIFKGDSEDE